MRLLQPNRTKLDIYRRHLKSCSHKDPQYMKCQCPLWIYGWLRGEQMPRTSLGTSDLAEAARQVAIMQDPDTPNLKTAEEAAEAWSKHILGLGAGTQSEYNSVAERLLEYTRRKKLKYMTELSMEVLDGFHATRRIALSTSARELRILRIFFGFALDRRWIKDNPAKNIKPPRNIKPSEIVPYTRNEIMAFFGACAAMGNSVYERKRADAMIYLMLVTGLRISDTALLAKDRILNGSIFLHTKKTGGQVWLALPEELLKK